MRSGEKNITINLILLSAISLIIAASPPPSRADNILSQLPLPYINTAEPVLYLAVAEANEIKWLPVDANTPPVTKKNLLVATHGWFEIRPWPQEMALAVAQKTGTEDWAYAWLDWQKRSQVITPLEAVIYARNKLGPVLGEKILQLSKNYEHVHLIGHSAGCWLISEAAKEITKKTNVDIHLTFLDAYVPAVWNEKELGKIDNDPNTVCWIDHYFNLDLTLLATAHTLSNAHNINITDADPGITDHEFPRYWYYATITGQYSEQNRCKGKPLFNHKDKFEYGFARSIEAGKKNWQKSIKLPCGNKPIKIRKKQNPLITSIKEFFKKISPFSKKD